jgi:HAD superfamily hydrolase (TIGR01490 family)
MKLALFDVDDTLLRGDCEALWCEYLTSRGLFDMSRISEFMHSYRNGGFDVRDFTRFQLQPLAQLEQRDLERHRRDYLENTVLPLACADVRARLEEHRAQEHVLVAISAAHDFLAEPISKHFSVHAALYTVGEQAEGRYTGEVAGTPCFGPGKIERLDAWLAEQGEEWSSVEESWFYSDSYNDLPLLERVNHAIAVRPDPRLRAFAQAAKWEIIDSGK